MPEIAKLMNTEVVTVEKGTPVIEAIKKLVKNNFTGLPVVDNQNHVIGIISEKDMLALAINNNHELCNSIDINLKVDDFMTSPAVTIDANESITAICSCFMKNNKAIETVGLLKKSRFFLFYDQASSNHFLI